MEKEIRTVCLTGHRDIPENHALLLPSLLKKKIGELIARGATDFRVGGAIGFDMLSELKILELREKYPQIRLRLFLPCHDQTKKWDEPSIRVYNYILARADSVQYTTEMYTRSCMLQRDQQLVTGSDFCIAYCTKNRGGSFYTLSYALSRDLEVYNLADDLPRIE